MFDPPGVNEKGACKVCEVFYLDNATLVHGDAVVWVFRELEEGLSRGLVHLGVFRAQVAHQRSHGSGVAERRAVRTPHAAASDGLGQIPPQPVVRLQLEAKTPPRVPLQLVR